MKRIAASPGVQARILWPALGFPAVVTPSDSPSTDSLRYGDATRCICVLVLSDKPLSKEVAARHLRYVPWESRLDTVGRARAFAAGDLTIRRESEVTIANRSDGFGQHVAFGSNGSRQHGIIACLAKKVRKFYWDVGLKHLQEIRVSEAATARLQQGQYHLFWSSGASQAESSGEMKLLLNRFARPRRLKLGAAWRQHLPFLVKEYELEYGGIHPPYRSRGAQKARAEILHPLFIEPHRSKPLRIGHVTDTHVDVRADVYEHNLLAARTRGAIGEAGYHNFNLSFARVYAHAKRDSDILLLTGDLIDYGRGHWGLARAGQLQDDSSYHVDRNWFLFYYLVASGKAYDKPVYTILGNHDWRLNPYPPFAPGAPNPNELLDDQKKLVLDKQRQMIRIAHGPGHDRWISYRPAAERWWKSVLKRTGHLFRAVPELFNRRVDVPGLPTETDIESVAWYLLSINPFLDYAFTLPGKQSVLMLDWGKTEHVLFPSTSQGVQSGLTTGTPRASGSLTVLQQRLVADFLSGPSKAKVVGTHAPPIGPHSDWYDSDLKRGRKLYTDPQTARGPIDGHPIFAMTPSKASGTPSGMVADRGSFVRARDEFIRALSDPKYSVRVVLSGHIHRNGLYLVYPAPKVVITNPRDSFRNRTVTGALLVRGLQDQTHAVRQVPPPAVARVPEGKRGPLYITTVSAGPRGSFEARQLTAAELKRGGRTTTPGYAHVELAGNGMIHTVEFRPPHQELPQPAAPAVRQREVAFAFQ